MKFARLGESGSEIAVVHDGDRRFDLRPLTSDVYGEFLADDPVSRAAAAISAGLLRELADTALGGSHVIQRRAHRPVAGRCGSRGRPRGVVVPGRSTTRSPMARAGKCASAITTASEWPMRSRWSISPVSSGLMPSSMGVLSSADEAVGG